MTWKRRSLTMPEWPMSMNAAAVCQVTGWYGRTTASSCVCAHMKCNKSPRHTPTRCTCRRHEQPSSGHDIQHTAANNVFISNNTSSSSSSLFHFYVRSIWDDSSLHAARSYTSFPGSPFSLTNNTSATSNRI